MHSLPLSKEQAVALASKIWDEDEKTKEFCRQLRDELYDNKICTGDEAAECKNCLQSRMEKIGYTIPVDRGDSQLT